MNMLLILSLQLIFNFSNKGTLKENQINEELLYSIIKYSITNNIVSIEEDTINIYIVDSISSNLKSEYSIENRKIIISKLSTISSFNKEGIYLMLTGVVEGSCEGTINFIYNKGNIFDITGSLDFCYNGFEYIFYSCKIIEQSE